MEVWPYHWKLLEATWTSCAAARNQGCRGPGFCCCYDSLLSQSKRASTGPNPVEMQIKACDLITRRQTYKGWLNFPEKEGRGFQVFRAIQTLDSFVSKEAPDGDVETPRCMTHSPADQVDAVAVLRKVKEILTSDSGLSILVVLLECSDMSWFQRPLFEP